MKFAIIENLEVIEVVEMDLTEDEFNQMEVEEMFEEFGKDYYSDNVCNEMTIMPYVNYLEIHTKNLVFIETFEKNNG